VNALPQSRRVINGRTFSQSWSAAQHDPIEAYRKTDRLSSFFLAVVCVAGCAVIGALCAQAF
jgi:hypothetical protein